MKTVETGPSAEGDRLLVIHVDGASRGNPGSAGAGVWITDAEGREIAEMSRYLGHKTNNEAEYLALLLGLGEAKRLGARHLRAFTDSELVERQIKGLYRVKDPDLRSLHGRVIQHLKEFSSFKIESVSRKENKEADRLANQAIERRRVKEKSKGETRRRGDGRPSSRPERRDPWGEESPSSTGQGGP
jgi:ribonuclease HI